MHNRAAHSVCSPPPCGEGLGVGVRVGGHVSRNNNDPPPHPSPTRGEGADRVCCEALRKLTAILPLLALAACDFGGGFGYVEIKSIPATPAVALYFDSVKLEPIRNGNAVLRQKVGTIKLQSDGDGGQLAVLCNIEVRKNRITTVTVSPLERPPRCQCRNNGWNTAARTCVS